MHELRRHRRIKIPLLVEIQHPAVGVLQTEALDMSDNGIFVLVDNTLDFKLGELLKVRTLGLGIDGQETGPVLDMRIVRMDETGLGLQLVESPGLETDQAQDSTLENLRAVNQSLFIINSQRQVLFLLQGDRWCLPSRKLESAENWQAGINQAVEQLKSESAITIDSELEAASECYPIANQSSCCVNLIIPCRIIPSSASPTSVNQAKYRWVDAAEISSMDCKLEPELIDKLLGQG